MTCCFLSATARDVRMAGAGGFEPPNGGIKTRCLATWRRPKKTSLNSLQCRESIQTLHRNRRHPRGGSGDKAARARPLYQTRQISTRRFPSFSLLENGPPSHFHALRISGYSAMATGCRSLRPAPEKKAATVIGAVLRVNSGWPKISAVCTSQAGIMTAYQRGRSERGDKSSPMPSAQALCPSVKTGTSAPSGLASCQQCTLVQSLMTTTC